jgi:hypothetical protein
MAMNVPPVLTGCTDFIVEFAGDFDPESGIDYWTPRGRPSQIRWYGVRRDTDGDGNDDVMPVSVAVGGRRQFEKELPSGRNPERYICVWGPADMELNPQGRTQLPMLIRITVRLVDANGRLGSGITQEYIFKLRH